MHRHLTGLAELGSVQGEHPVLQIDVHVAQSHRLGHPQPAAADQTEQRLEDNAAQARCRAEPARGTQQFDELLVAVDVRRLSLGQTTEDRIVGDLGARLELPQPSRERAQQLEPARPGARIGAAVAVAPRPVGHDLHGQRPAVADGTDVAREAAQGVSRLAQIEAQTPPVDQIALDPGPHGGRAHAALPGHGKATSTSLRLSSLA
jgi:hypothetical protein